jgi:hypothetical protein
MPFSPDGINSLIVSNNSPKIFQHEQPIGYKGLGFRSVLELSSTVLISSGNLSIYFSKETATFRLESLVSENSRVKEKVQSAVFAGLPYPVSVLSFPSLLDLRNPPRELSQEVISRVRELREKGFETVICLLFDNPNEAFAKVQNQLNEMTEEVLLFLKNLESIEIDSPNKKSTFSVNRREDIVCFEPSGPNPRLWKIFSDEGHIPDELLQDDNRLFSKYEIKIAIGSKDSDTHRLFVYFPTEVLFPFPILAHCTFELADNREYLIETDVNKWLAGRLATRMVEIAEQLCDPKEPWGAIMKIAPRGDIDPVLSKLGFDETLRLEVREKPIVPVRDGKFISANLVKRIHGNFDDLLDDNLFSDICLFTEDQNLEQLLDQMNTKYIDYKDLQDRLNIYSRKSISVERRAQIIYQLLEEDIIADTTPELLVDDNGEIISSESRPLLPPEEKSFTLPKWSRQKIVDANLCSHLKQLFKLSGIRDLYSRLSEFSVQLYSLATPVSSLVAETNRRVESDPHNELTIRKEMLEAIWQLYCEREALDPPSLRSDTTISLPTEDGRFLPSDQLYLGDSYPAGQLTHAMCLS